MAKSKKRLTLREQVDKLKRQNRALRRAWQKARRDFFQMARMNDDAHRDFIGLRRIVNRLTKQNDRIAEQKNRLIEQKNYLEYKQILERTCALLEMTTRDPTTPLQ